MARVCEWLDDNVYNLGDAQDQDGDCQRGSKASSSGGVKRRAAEARPVAGQKRQLKGRDQDDEGSENDENSEQKPNKKRTKTDEDDDRPKFACPYYKHDPVRYKSHRTCVGPGWHEIHRVKCFDTFKTEKALQGHTRATVACTVLDEQRRKLDPGAGMDQETEKHLRARRQSGKHNGDKHDDVSKWYEVYYTLFPGTQDIGNPPSPWYDTNPDKTNAGDSNSKGLEFLKYLRRELPHMIQRELEKDLNRSFERYGDGLMDSLSIWIRDSSARCAQIFEHIPSPAQVADLDDPETAQGSRAVSPQVSPDTDLTVSVGEEAGASTGVIEGALDFDFGIPDIDISSLLNFDLPNIPSDFPTSDDQCPTYPDSAYGTGSVEDASGARRSYM
ncbi:hypothetical protein COL516b_007228 [Colletotrichum fioriniae]|nr:uncharacterized protein COL516b_007228 [Colletotrichum fioriniae]KAJ0302177.1 hypothetical protein COL516b_007228 [Colletotrichum fioriniae]